jgi:nucleoid-associated protein YgaU
LIITLALEAAAVASLHFLGGIAAPVRVALLVAAWWLFAGTLFRVIAQLTGAPRVLRASARVTPPSLRYRVDRALVASLVAGTMFVAATPAGATDATADPPVDSAAVEGPAGAPPVVDAPPVAPPPVDTPAVDPPAADPAPPVEVRTGMAADPAAATAPVAEVPEVDASATVRTPVPATSAAEGSRPAAQAAAAVAPEPTSDSARNDVSLPEVSEGRALPVTQGASGSYTVVAGDTLWDIAARRVAESTGRAMAQLTNAEVVTYWVRVCEANRTRLRSGDPNLIYAGEVIDLPEV